ncbi:DNA repair protein RecN [Desulfococcus sp.]|uniref:DNA repair protein RecN n=1 Tax=Desulfococcus sp. TaxID=2025834 RepID=UPI003593B1B8
MLRELSIKNFAIIDDLHIRFDSGFTIMSGETGAGKSIIINAVNLILGSRAAAGWIRTGSETAEIEAFFEIDPNGSAARIMAENDLDPAEGLMIRRIIARNNRHRIYINQHPATIRLLAVISENLACISGQHAHQGLLDEDQHLRILDQFGGLLPLREAVGERFRELAPLIRNLDDLKGKKAHQGEQIELLGFQKQEILAADIQPDEDARLERELIRLKNGEVLYQAVNSGIGELYSTRNAVVERLGEVKKQLEKASRIDPDLAPRVEGIAEATFRIEEIVNSLRSYLGTIQMDDRRLEAVDERLNRLRALKRKYGGSLASVADTLAGIDAALAGIENLADEIAAAEKTLARHRQALAEHAVSLSRKRAETGRDLAGKVEAELARLSMSSTRFAVAMSPVPASEATHPDLFWEDAAIGCTGIDRAAFMIAPNVGEELKPLSAIASGGELSRVVLALKAILAATDAVETLIFDEVDAGIGGGVAEIVGQKLAALARRHQVLCITHLPQIAKFADHHFAIAKNVHDGRTRTTLRPLDDAERVRELARMLGGVEMTQATLDHAREMFEKR